MKDVVNLQENVIKHLPINIPTTITEMPFTTHILVVQDQAMIYTIITTTIMNMSLMVVDGI